MSNNLIRSISGLLGKQDSLTRLAASTAPPTDPTLPNSPRRLSDLVESNVLVYLRNAGWGSSGNLGPKYVERYHLAEKGDPELKLSKHSPAKEKEQSVLASVNNIVSSAVDSVLVMIPLEIYRAFKIQSVQKDLSEKHVRSACKISSSVTTTEILGCEDLQFITFEEEDQIEDTSMETFEREGEESEPYIVPGYMDFNALGAAASTLKASDPKSANIHVPRRTIPGTMFTHISPTKTKRTPM